ncbi:MAG: DUF4179 domain-containing protein [Ruminococcus sp.]|nr:DUF4179 domain-containing protein [Ruminococcus sp.]
MQEINKNNDKNNMLDTLSTNEIPEIVNQKCKDAYAQIRREAITMSSKKPMVHKKRMLISAACIAAVVGVGFTLPVAAEYITPLHNIYSYFSGKDVYSKVPEEKNNLEEYAKSINITQTDKDVSATLQDIYFDGKNISFTCMLSNLPEQFKDSEIITASMSANIDGNYLDLSNRQFIACNEGYCAVFNSIYDGKAIENNSSKFSFKIQSLTGMDLHTYILDDVYNEEGESKGGGYQPKETDALPVNISLESQISPDAKKYVKTYDVNETWNNFTLKSITVSPFSTEISLDGEFDDYQSFRVKDQNGETLEGLGKEYYAVEAPLKGTTSLSIEIFRLDEDDFPTEHTFTIPIEQGYRTASENEYNGIKPEDITYIPPLPEESEEVDRTVETPIYNIDSPKDVMREDWGIFNFEDESKSAYIDTKITEARVATGEEMESLLYSYENGENYERCKERGENYDKLLLLTYELTNVEDYDIYCYFHGTNIITKDKKYLQYYNYDPIYVSYQDNGGKAAYKYDFAPNETKTVTVGYFITDEELEKGLLSIPWDCDGDYNAYSIPEIK